MPRFFLGHPDSDALEASGADPGYYPDRYPSEDWHIYGRPNSEVVRTEHAPTGAAPRHVGGDVPKSAPALAPHGEVGESRGSSESEAETETPTYMPPPAGSVCTEQAGGGASTGGEHA